ncbi:sensor histidine kinase [Aurantimonas aggregata]|uniref:histidine kinase n=1 Tax=Aurantimonas aggregata TaxID=2047720 RepID=A0A6L9ME73_9HYPH|nr:HAMP domain-containing sensor histidine kinase [Aurantimonas aggregata]NDV86163.1 sensor histidine kinase [Aurantimonas aggregata]
MNGPGGDQASVQAPPRTGRRRLSRRLLVITMLAVMLAEVLIFVPSIANFRENWLEAKLETAAVAGVASEGSEAQIGAALDADQGASLLVALDAMLVAIVEGGASRLIARADMIDVAELQIDLADRNPVPMILGAFDTLLFGGDRTMRIYGPVGESALVAEVVMSERPLRRDMLIYSRNILFLSLAIASFAALLVYVAISYYLVRPIQAITGAMIRFGENPADPSRIIRPSGRGDEIGTAEAQLADMQARLAGTLREQRHLADLGLAVAKINHDLRNILASAQMVSDRLADVPDPRVQRVVPPLVRSLDRALSYTQSVLSYGRAIESPPEKRAVRLARLVDDVFEVVAPPEGTPIEFVNAVPKTLEIAVDPGQFHRVLVNLCRNAVQALEGDAADLPSLVRRITVVARPEPGDEVLVSIEDTGPGLPARARDNLFKAFQGSARTGGTGLGLAIVAEIVQAHGGRIALAERRLPGTRFEIHLPARADGLAGESRSG